MSMGLMFLIHIDGLVQERRNSRALTMKLRFLALNHRYIELFPTTVWCQNWLLLPSTKLYNLGTMQRHFVYFTHSKTWFNHYIMWTWSSWICIGGGVHYASVRHCSKLNLLHLKLIRWITPTLIYYLQSTWWIKQHKFLIAYMKQS